MMDLRMSLYLLLTYEMTMIYLHDIFALYIFFQNKVYPSHYLPGTIYSYFILIKTYLCFMQYFAHFCCLKSLYAFARLCAFAPEGAARCPKARGRRERGLPSIPSGISGDWTKYRQSIAIWPARFFTYFPNLTWTLFAEMLSATRSEVVGTCRAV